MLKDEGIQLAVSWLPLRSWSLSKGNSNRDIVWCFAQQCWHQVANEPCFLGGSRCVAFKIHNIKNQGNAFLSSCSILMSSSCKPSLWRADCRLLGNCPAKLLLLYFPSLCTHLKRSHPLKSQFLTLFFLPILQKIKLLILFIFPLKKSDKKSEQSLILRVKRNEEI